MGQIQEQLNQIYWLITKLKTGDQSNGFKVHTKFNLILKLYKLYIFGSSIFFLLKFGTKIYFYYFFPSLRDKREREREIVGSNGREGKLL